MDDSMFEKDLESVIIEHEDVNPASSQRIFYHIGPEQAQFSQSFYAQPRPFTGPQGR